MPVEVDEFTEYTGVKCDLPINVEPKDFFDPFIPASLLFSVTLRSNHRAVRLIVRGRLPVMMISMDTATF